MAEGEHSDAALERLMDGARSMGIELPADRAALLIAYLDAFLDENTRVNLTAITDREEAVVRHVLDSLSVVPVWHELEGPAPPRTVVDLGTGGGFPAIPLAVMWPEARVIACDGRGKKVQAIERALADAGGPSNVEPRNERVEQMAGLHREMKGTVDLLVARAVGPTANVLKAASRLMRRGGLVFSMKGTPPDDEVEDAANLAAKIRFAPLRPRTTSVPLLLARTVLVYRRQ